MKKLGKPSLWVRLGLKKAPRRPLAPEELPLRSKADILEEHEEVVATKTIEKHRRRIIRRAQQYHSFFINTNQRVVSVSLGVLIVAALVFGGLVYFSLYRNQDYSDFAYNMTRALPLPVAKVGKSFISYEEYLSNLRRQVHYFEIQQSIDFSQPTDDAQVALVELKNEAMKQAIDRAYIKMLAAERDLSVTEGEIDEQLALLQSQNKLGGGIEDVGDVLDNFWGISLEKYRQIIADNILMEKVTRAIDKETGNNAVERIEQLSRRLSGGEDFGDLALLHSEDATTAVNNGEYNFPVALEGRDEDPAVLQAIFETPIGQFSGIVDTGRRLVIVKVLSDEGSGRRRAAQISISYLLPNEVLKDIREGELISIYIDGVTYADF